MINELIFPAIYFSTSLTGLIIATYTDLKKRIVPDTLTASLLALGLGLHVIESLLTNSLNPLLLSVESTLFAFLFGYALGLLGVWAGGDIKLLTGLAALNPLAPALLNKIGLSLTWHAVTLPIWAFTFFAYSALSVIPYTLILAVIRTSKKKQIRWKPFKDQRQRLPEIIQVGLLIGGLGPLLAKINQPAWLIIPILLLFELAKKKGQPLTHHAVTAAIIIFTAGAINTPVPATSNAILTSATILVLSLILSYVSLIKEHVLEKDVKITDLKEGTIIAEFIYEINAKGKKAIKREKMSINGLVKQIQLEKNKNVKLITNPHEAAGITQKNLTYLKKLVKQGKVKNKVRVQESIPFVPIFLLGYLLSALIGDTAWAFII